MNSTILPPARQSWPPAEEADPPAAVVAAVAVARGVLGWACLVGFVAGLVAAQLLFAF